MKFQTLNLLTLLLAVILSAAAQNGYQLFQQGLAKERADSDLRGAVQIYERVVRQSSNDRKLAAQALYRIGECQRALGNTEARKAYERIVRDFADQKEQVAEAQARLVAMGTAFTGNTEARARLVWDDATDLWGTASNDGRYLSFTDWSTGDVALRDLVTGQSRRLSDKRGWTSSPRGEAWASAISPDGQRVAFAWALYEWKAQKNMELRVIGADGKGERLLRASNEYMAPQSWSPDGRWIAVLVRDEDPTIRINRAMLVSAETGETNVIPTTATGVKNKITFSPDGKWLAYGVEQNTAAGGDGVFVVSIDGSTPETRVAGNAQMMGWTPDGRSLLITRQRNGENQLFMVEVAGGRAVGEPTQIRTATSIGSVPLGVTREGALLSGTQNRRVDAVVAEFDSSARKIGKTELRFPARGIGGSYGGGALRFSPDGSRFLCAVPPNGVLIHSMTDGTEHTVLPQLSQVRRVEWSSDGSSMLVSGTGTDGKSGIYRVDAVTGAATLVTEIAPAMVFAQSPDGKAIYYRKARQGGDVLAVRDIASGSERVLIENNVYATVNFRFSRDGKKLAMAGGRYYLGILDIASGQVKDIYKPADPTAGPRVAGMDWTADDQEILMLMELSGGAYEAWLFSVDGGDSVRQPLSNHAHRLSISRDGRHIGMIQTESHNQVWVLENFLPPTSAAK